jgi:anti-sigma factor RsiW
MSLSQETMIELMAYADGELAEADRARVSELVKSDADAARVVASMVRVGDWTRAAADDAEHASSSIANSIADGVMDQIDGRASKKPMAPVGDLAAMREKRAIGVKFALGVAALVAIAASFVLLTRGTEEVEPPVAKLAPAELPAPPPTAKAPIDPMPAMAAAVQSGQALGVEIGKIDSQSKDVSVFYLPPGAGSASSDNGGAPSVVIWLGDDPAGAKK